MKFVVLLALVGLASCRTTLKGGDQARDVTIEYTYIDDHGKEVTVEVKADRLGLDLSQDDSRLTLKKTTSSASIERPRFVQVERQQAPAAPQFRSVLPQVAAAEPAAPRIAPAFRFVELDDFETPEARFVQVEAPRLQNRFVQVEAPRQKIEPRFVQVEVPRTKVETRFVKVEVPEPDFETRFVQVQSPRRESRTHLVQAKTVAAAGPRSAPAPTHFMQLAKSAFAPSSFQVPHPAFTAQLFPPHRALDPLQSGATASALMMIIAQRSRLGESRFFNFFVNRMFRTS